MVFGTMCDHYLGQVLDAMDKLALWGDTLLIVGTDHGFLLGEHDWWAKNVQPWYNEVSHIPLFIWDPRTSQQGTRRESLVQWIDFAPTLLEFFNVPIPETMQGTPPLMGLDFYRKAVTLQQKYRRPGIRILNALQTNGTRLDDEWCVFFHEHNFLIGLSLDGPGPLHDAYRVDKGGQPTFDKVMAGLALLKRHQVEFNILTCVHAANADFPLDVYRFLRDEADAEFIQFIPIVERMHPLRFQEGTHVSPRSVSGDAYGRFLNTIFDEWVQHDVGRVSVQMFDVALATWLGEPSGLCIFDETCGRGLAMEHNGDVYSCDHFVEPRHRLGNMQVIPLADLAGSAKQRRFGLAKRETLPRACRECPVLFACHGGCPKDRLLQTADGEPGLNYLCAGYKAFFTHVDAPIKRISALLRRGRPITDVMTLP